MTKIKLQRARFDTFAAALMRTAQINFDASKRAHNPDSGCTRYPFNPSPRVGSE